MRKERTDTPKTVKLLFLGHRNVSSAFDIGGFRGVAQTARKRPTRAGDAEDNSPFH